MKTSVHMILAVAFLAGTPAAAQDLRSRYEQFLRERTQAYKEYVDARNVEYARYMRERWIQAPEHPAVEAEPQPAPRLPETPSAAVPDKPRALPVAAIVDTRDLPGPVAPDRPAAETPSDGVPVSRPLGRTGPQVSFTFVGTEYAVSGVRGPKPRLRDVSENSVAALWEEFSFSAYRAVTDDCLELRNVLRLDDWGYLKMLEALTAAWYSDQREENEAVLLQTYLLVQSGYKVRMARSGQRLILLLPSSDMLYGCRYLELNGEKYFVIGNRSGSDGYYVFDRAFPGERLLVMRPSVPNLPERTAPLRHLVSAKYPDMQADVGVCLNLVNYYALFPCCDVAVYQIPAVGNAVQRTLYPALLRSLEGRSPLRAAGMLLDFVQTAFPYRTDLEQFGYERPLFAEETLFYPYCDCEDRAVLYALLVRELLDLDVVLLQYPGHVATAVHFEDEEVPGDYVLARGKRYTVCDPTYIGAGVGRSMFDSEQTKVEVILQ